MPPRQHAAKDDVLWLNVVLAKEIDAPLKIAPLRWVLLTTEVVDKAQQALTIVRYDESRWLIEDYHKAWKSGVGVERQRFQSPDNLERMMAITAFLAVRLLQLRENHSDKTTPCDAVLSTDEWKVLWISSQRCAVPLSPPSAHWAYLALAKLGGFADTKHTGRPGWNALWHGWFRLQDRLEGYRLSQLTPANL